jgi:hypothetical protein
MHSDGSNILPSPVIEPNCWTPPSRRRRGTPDHLDREGAVEAQRLERHARTVTLVLADSAWTAGLASRDLPAIIPGGGASSSDKDSSRASADPEEQTQQHNGKKAEEEHQPDHNNDHFDRSPPAHPAPTSGVSAAFAG